MHTPRRALGPRGPRWAWAALSSLALVACATVAPVGDGLRGLGPSSAARTLAQLDASGDGRLDEADWRVLDRLAETARAAVGGDEALAPTAGLYQGPPADAPPVFSLVGSSSDGPDLSAVPAERLRELVFEARWAAGQARLVSSAGIPLDGRGFAGALRERLPDYDPQDMEPAAVCGGLERFDLEPYLAGGVPAVAVFDLDSTIWHGNVSETFLAVLVERKVPRPESNARLQAFLRTVPGIDVAQVDANDVYQNAALLYERAIRADLPKEQRVNAKDNFEQTVGLLAGLDVATVQAAARAAVEEGAGPPFDLPPHGRLFYADEDGCGMRRVIEILEGRGVQVYVLSATLHPLAEEARRLLGLPEGRVLGSLLEIRDGVYTGEVADSTYYAKGAIIRQWLPGPPLFAFGDSPTSDFSMLLEAAGPAFMINPRDSFRRRDEEEAGARLVAVQFDGTEHSLGAPQVAAP